MQWLGVADSSPVTMSECPFLVGTSSGSRMPGGTMTAWAARDFDSAGFCFALGPDEFKELVPSRGVCAAVWPGLRTRGVSRHK